MNFIMMSKGFVMNVLFKRANVDVIASHDSGEAISQRRDGVILSEVCKDAVEGSSAFLLCILAMLLVACDFHGPWEYYPDEREVYTGIYTYGVVVAGERPKVCFSKVYELDETSAESFAFYKSAKVTLQGRFGGEWGTGEEESIRLASPASEPNCFYPSSNKISRCIYVTGIGGVSCAPDYTGIAGETYTLEATFEWDSAGHNVESTYRAKATIPNPVKVKGFNIPKQDGSFEWVEYSDGNVIEMDFLEYPMDMEFVRTALDYDHSVRGVLSIMNYGSKNGEATNTTINKMFEGVTNEDDQGYCGIAMHDPLETQQSLGFAANYIIGGIRNLDTLHLTNMMLPVGKFTVDLYATDEAYIDYVDKVQQSVSDSRVIPESNIENGMGVFTGMARTTVTMQVNSEKWVTMGHIADRHCLNEEGDNSDSWDSKGCRLYLDIYCAGGAPSSDLVRANEQAYSYYSGGSNSYYLEDDEACYPSDVKAAMMQAKEGWDIDKWSEYLPDTISAEQKSKAYADGLKRYCVASNFESNKLANCKSLEEECLESPEKTNCKEYLWQWCSDRDWDLSYKQCQSALVSRYYLKNVKSSIIKRKVQTICRGEMGGYYSSNGRSLSFDGDISVCKHWCKEVDGKMECP